jgi:hypothetical protein
MKKNDSLPIPKWLVKNEKLELPNGHIVTFAGVHDNKIIVTKEGEKIHGTFVIRDDEYDFHVTETIKGKKEDYRSFFKIHKDFILGVVEANMVSNKHLIEKQEVKSWIATKNYAINIHNPEYPKIPRTDFFWDIEPELLPKLAMDKKILLRCKFEIAVAHRPDGTCIGLIIPKQEFGTFIVVTKDFLELVFDACIGIAWFKGTLHAHINK